MRRILALQLKRIGDLVLTAPALAALRRVEPESQIVLAAYGGASELLAAFPGLAGGIAFGPGRGWAPWQQVLTGGFDVVLDFTGNDRSATAAFLSRASTRIAFETAGKSPWRRMAYHRLVSAPVRESHTIDHYRTLAGTLGGISEIAPEDLRLEIPAASRVQAKALLHGSGITGEFVVIHPGTARAEKYWVAERWAEVVDHLASQHGVSCVLTGGSDAYEAAHLRQIVSAVKAPLVNLAGRLDLLTLAELASRARLVVSCDTAIVHLAAASETPQVALFGPTNPFHWRPRHARARVLSAAHPEEPMRQFEPRQKGAAMDRLPAGSVLRAIDSLLGSDGGPCPQG